MTIILWATGIIATIIFGIPGILTLLRRGKLTFVKESSFCLFDSIVKNLPDITISYKDSPIASNLVLLKGFIVNTGNKDIIRFMVEKDLEAHLPKDYKWIKATTVRASAELDINITIKDNQTLTFSTGQFRCNEFIQFEALVEVPIKTKPKKEDSAIAQELEKDITFTHRIADIGKIEKTTVYPLKDASLNLWALLVPLILSISMCIIIFIVAKDASSSYQIAYPLTLEPNKTIETTIWPQKDNRVKVREIRGSFVEIMPLEKFLSKTNGNFKIIPHPKEKLIKTGMLTVILFPVYVFYLLLLSDRLREIRNRKLRQSLGL